KEVGMVDRLNEILEEVVLVRKDFGYPVMATPYSQIVGAQAMENVLSGERYKQFTDEAVKYVVGCYGEPVGPIDGNLRDKIMSQPMAKQFANWQPDNYLKSVEELRKEVGPDLSDDELLLKILIPGQPLKRGEAKKDTKQPVTKPATPLSVPAAFPTEFNVEVDGEAFNVKISPAWDGEEGAEATAQAEKVRSPKETKKEKEMPAGAVVAGMAGLVLSVEVKVGDTVSAGDLLAMIEAMKMRRQVNAPQGGTIKEILAQVGEIVQPKDVLMVVQ
ncbi:MAG: hypothetical protein JXL84_22670, partial [Deltaproteobacteria bacterium]|nr:hypothetical protein [Deltaproteobacteria bacterium]